MNERIRALWKQAGGHYNSGNQHTWPEYTIDDPEKFAELIVEECVEQIINRERSDGEWYQDDIFIHFGVEE